MSTRSIATGAPASQPAALRRLDPEDLGDHLDRLYRAAWAMCGNREDAEDLVQESYARVLSRSRWLRGSDDLGYLLRVLRNTHVSRIRGAARRPAPAALEHGAEPHERRAAWDPESASGIRELFELISSLPSSQRDVLVAVDLVGLSYREAAAALRILEATLTTRLHRARARVTRELGAADVRNERLEGGR